MGGDPFAEAAGGGEEFGVGARATEKAGEECGEKGVAGADGVHHGDGLRVDPRPTIGAEETGAARAGGHADGGNAELGREGAGVGFFAAGRFGRVGGEAGGFGGVEFEDVGERGEAADEGEVVVGGAEVDVENAQGGEREGGGEAGEGLAVIGGAEGERAEDEGGRGGGGGEGRAIGGDVIPGDVGRDGVVRIAGRAEGGGDAAGGRGGVAGDSGGGEALRVEVGEEFLAEFIAADGGDGEDGDAEAVEVVGDVTGGAAGDGAVGEEIPEEFAEAENGGGHF